MWTTDEILALRAMAMRLSSPAVTIDPRDIVKVMCNESNCLPQAHNPGGAVGLIQFVPQTLHDMGWTTGTDAFAELSTLEQLPYVERYFRVRIDAIRAAGGGVAAFYIATFLPAFIAHAGQPSFILCGAQGPLSWAYAANKSFDTEKKGNIVVADMSAAAERAFARSTAGQAIVAQLDALDAAEPDDVPTTPELEIALSGVPDIPEES